MRRNRERDAYATATAQALGWAVIRIWECEITSDPAAVAHRVLQVA
jgi:DNA mismatch endonuclease (patch repair protein)